jgi:hypothetical protein
VLAYSDDARGPVVLIPQTAHALAAWQIAARWGNRRFARPSPRAEVLAAVLLHDGGWTDFDAAPTLDGSGRARTFDRMQPAEHLAIWRACVARAALSSRYSALLIAAHVAALAEGKARDLARSGDHQDELEVRQFLAENAHLQERWRESLAADRRFAPALEGAGWEVNRRLLTAADAISVHLCGALPAPFTTIASDRTRQPVEISFERLERRLLCARPWPFEGDRVRVHCQGWQMERLDYESPAALAAALEQAPLVRLDFSIARPSALARARSG